MTTDRPAEDTGVLHRISALVEREHRLRTAHAEGAPTGVAQLRELADAEVELDRCWDLLRQRRAQREHGGDPDRAEVRPAAVVEGYLQ
jgi:hypothetical protein